MRCEYAVNNDNITNKIKIELTVLMLMTNNHNFKELIYKELIFISGNATVKIDN